jgi:hypothetical protein
VSVRAALVCYRNLPNSAEWTYWADLTEARQAEAELCPCGPLCAGIHSAVHVDIVPEPRAGRTTVASREVGR